MSKKSKIFKIILGIIVVLMIIGIIAYLFPVMKNISTNEGRIEFKNRVQSSGILGILMLFGLQVAQIFLIIVPGEPIEILAGMCYGSINGTIFILISAAIISTSIFFLVRKLGRKFVYEFCSEERIEKIENSKLFKNPKRIEYILLLLYLIPGTPKDLFAYVSGLLPIKPLNFILISTFGRIPSVISSTVAGANIILGNWKLSIILYAGVLLLVAIAIFIMSKFDKSNSTKDIIESINNKEI